MDDMTMTTEEYWLDVVDNDIWDLLGGYNSEALSAVVSAKLRYDIPMIAAEVLADRKVLGI